MDKPRYTVEIVIAAPGTPLVDEKGVQKVANGVPQTSAPEHMFYVLQVQTLPSSFSVAALPTDRYV